MYFFTKSSNGPQAKGATLEEIALVVEETDMASPGADEPAHRRENFSHGRGGQVAKNF